MVDLRIICPLQWKPFDDEWTLGLDTITLIQILAPFSSPSSSLLPHLLAFVLLLLLLSVKPLQQPPLFNIPPPLHRHLNPMLQTPLPLAFIPLSHKTARHSEDTSPLLFRLDCSRDERSTVAEALDVVEHGEGGVAGEEEVCVEGVWVEGSLLGRRG